MNDEKKCVSDGPSCPFSQYEVLETFDYVDLPRICAFLKKI